MEVVVLGSGGWMPGGGRETTCVALRIPSALVLFDAGTGLARLAQPGYGRLLDGARSLHLLLSHLHLDHTVGLSYLPALRGLEEVTIHVPAWICEGNPEVLGRLIGPPFFPYTFDHFSTPVTVTTIREGRQDIAGLEVTVRRQVHPGGSAGYRVGDRLAFLTDTVFDPGALPLVQGVELLMHEAWIRGEGDDPELRRTLDSHSAAEDAARLAYEGRVGELLLTHLNPLRGPAYLAGVLTRAREVFPATQLAFDGWARLLSD